MTQKFFKNILKYGSILIIAPILVYFIGCNNMKTTPSNEVVIGLTILQIYQDGYHFDALDKSITLSEAKAIITTKNYSKKIVYIAFSNDDKIAKLVANDTMVCQIKREILERHLNDIKDPAKAYLHLSSADLVILSMKTEKGAATVAEKGPG